MNERATRWLELGEVNSVVSACCHCKSYNAASVCTPRLKAGCVVTSLTCSPSYQRFGGFSWSRFSTSGPRRAPVVLVTVLTDEAWLMGTPGKVVGGRSDHL